MKGHIWLKIIYKNAGKVQVIVSIGNNYEKFFVTNKIQWRPKKVIGLYLG